MSERLSTSQIVALREALTDRGVPGRKMDGLTAKQRKERTRRNQEARRRAKDALARAFPVEYTELCAMASEQIEHEEGHIRDFGTT